MDNGWIWGSLESGFWVRARDLVESDAIYPAQCMLLNCFIFSYFQPYVLLQVFVKLVLPSMPDLFN